MKAQELIEQAEACTDPEEQALIGIKAMRELSEVIAKKCEVIARHHPEKSDLESLALMLKSTTQLMGALAGYIAGE